MELLTDIFAIFGWAMAGSIIPYLTIFKSSVKHECDFSSKFLFVSFCLIPASLVLE